MKSPIKELNDEIKNNLKEYHQYIYNEEQKLLCAMY